MNSTKFYILLILFISRMIIQSTFYANCTCITHSYKRKYMRTMFLLYGMCSFKLLYHFLEIR